MPKSGNSYEMNDYKVYVHTNISNGMKYVGITKQAVNVRWQDGNGYRKQQHFWRAIKKYGWKGFTHEVVADGLTKEQACQLEQELIEQYKTTDNRFGYNKSTGGESGGLGVKHNEKQRKAASNNLKKCWNDPEFRKKACDRYVAVMLSDEVKKKRALAQVGRPVTETTRRLISEHRKGKNTGPFTEEHKRRIRENHSGGSVPVPVKCVETGKLFDCINDAARLTGINKKQISGCCRHVPHYNTAGGYHWEYANGTV